ncbi:hypothetical protein [Pseudoalteromonas umbrosa]|uniref:hypothetical protein n=1 Tax=Pseudoalteromonas umbrosa TaxID=3048489 RepID=UPI0024C2D103|nr:hypothetical protein [Pseudoalteromonas sp. B95]MDK1286798.1 hypothetical protein [Pseudoalteromonas sp. B95]
MSFRGLLFKGILPCTLLATAGCDGDPYTGFGCIANESHPAVGHARALSAQQLQQTYFTLKSLRSVHTVDVFGKVLRNEDIPDSLHFLEADSIKLRVSGLPYVVLANCFDERIELRLTSPESQNGPSITLQWAAPTKNNAYAIGMQVLWEMESL